MKKFKVWSISFLSGGPVTDNGDPHSYPDFDAFDEENWMPNARRKLSSPTAKQQRKLSRDSIVMAKKRLEIIPSGSPLPKSPVKKTDELTLDFTVGSNGV